METTELNNDTLTAVDLIDMFTDSKGGSTTIHVLVPVVQCAEWIPRQIVAPQHAGYFESPFIVLTVFNVVCGY